MITRYDVTNLDRDSLPEEILHEINEYEGMGSELVSVKVINFDDDEINESMWDITFFEPFFSFEASEFDYYSFIRVCYQKWPTESVSRYYHNMTRGEMREALKYESKRQKEDIA